MTNYELIRGMRRKYNLIVPDKFDNFLFTDKEWLNFRTELLKEEFEEIIQSIEDNNINEFFDGLIDIVIISMGTAASMGFDWQQGFNEVMRANMSKVRGKAKDTKRKNSLDLIKPQGWIEPNLRPYLMQGVEIKNNLFSKAKEIKISKVSDYHNNKITIDDYFPFGLKSYIQMINLKVMRLRSLCDVKQINNESLNDTLIDLVNYTEMAYNFLEGKK